MYIRLLRQERLQRIGRTLAGARRHDDALSMDRNAGHLAELEAIAQQSAPRSASALAAPVRAVRRLSPYLSFLGLCIISVAWVEDPQKGALIFLQLTAGRREAWPALLKADSDATYQRRRAQVARAPPPDSADPRSIAHGLWYEFHGKEELTTPVRVLLSAFSCEPEKGSEREVGFRALLAAADRHEAWVLTRAVSVPVLRRFLAGHPLSARIHVEPVPFDYDEEGFGRTQFHWNYDRWQRAAGRRAVELDRRVDFDVVHHVSLATIWTRAGVAAVPKPLVWGPVGGGVEPPLSLMTELGLRGALDDLFRIASRRLLARLPPMRLAPDTAVVVLAQNQAIARRLRANAPIHVLPNATAVELDGIRAMGQRTRDVVLVGRLLAWKGGHLALRALRHVSSHDTMLRVYGEGPDLRRLRHAARRWDLADRVRFHDWVPRERLLPEIARAGALVHPSLHDDAPLSVAEALSLGTPVVCLDHGGPAEVTRRWPTSPSRRITPAGPAVTARRIAEAIDGFLADPPPLRSAPVRPNVSFADSLLAAYEQAAHSAARPKGSLC